MCEQNRFIVKCCNSLHRNGNALESVCGQAW